MRSACRVCSVRSVCSVVVRAPQSRVDVQVSSVPQIDVIVLAAERWAGRVLVVSYDPHGIDQPRREAVR